MSKLNTLGKILFWALVVLFLYDFATDIFDVIPDFDFLSHGVYAPLATLIIGLTIKDIIDEKQIVNMIEKGEFVNIPSIMSALQKTNKNIYDKVMKSQLLSLKKKTKEYEVQIEKERKKRSMNTKKAEN